MKIFKNHVQPKLNPVFTRYKFNNEVQSNTTFDQFVTKLKLLIHKFGRDDPGAHNIWRSIPQDKGKLINVETLLLTKPLRLARILNTPRSN